ncbi:hypothetical protein [uncultured Muribaculum sp.]|uniref:hypothetical protein n=1 Tax=uncultured Muribaculum sp. TaxID=1918613 RepID=UPI0025B147B3|nr:hypothetical protein [uncultured Muribaculum sp.]
MDYRDIDLGLSVPWADRNISSTMPRNPGSHYSWGDNLKWRSERGYYAIFDNIPHNICGNADFDIATIETGGRFRLPTTDEIKELINNCKWTWIDADDESYPLSGYDVCGPNGNRIFLPAAGYGRGSVDGESFVEEYDIYGCYWSGQIDPDNNLAHCLLLKRNTVVLDSEWRSKGLSIRPVLNK